MDKNYTAVILIAVLVNIVVLITAILKIGTWTGVVNTSLKYLAAEVESVKVTLAVHTKTDNDNFEKLTNKVNSIEIKLAERRLESRRSFNSRRLPE